MSFDANEHLNYVLELDKRAKNKDHIFMYDGFVDQSVSKFFADQVKNKIDSENIDYLLANRLYHIMVECFQNIVRHSDDLLTGNHVKDTYRYGFLSVGKTDEFYFVTTGNIISKTNQVKLSAWLDKVNALDTDGVKKLYKEILRENRLNDRGGAGLGFVDMRKRTKNTIDYKLKELNEVCSFLVLNVKILINQAEE